MFPSTAYCKKKGVNTTLLFFSFTLQHFCTLIIRFYFEDTIYRRKLFINNIFSSIFFSFLLFSREKETYGC